MTNHTAALQQHTPGAWEHGGVVAINGHGHDVAYVHVGSNILAQVWKPEQGTDADTLANARLIAAAPELLESLRELHDWMREHATVSESLEMLTRSHAAIEKATHA